MSEKTIIVVGGGPAGMMAAGTAASKGNKVYLIEKNNNLGKKLAITGKGRCNITNYIDISLFPENIPVNGEFLYSAFYTFSNQQLISFFNNLGLKTKVERGNRVFPASGKAEDVVNTMQKYLNKNHVIIIHKKITKLLLDREVIKGVKLADSNIIYGDKVILATGGKSYPQTGSTGDGYKFARDAGHTINRLYPSLVPLKVKENWVNHLKSLQLKNIAIKLITNNRCIYEDFGEMNFIKNGISGPVILSASSHLRNIEDNNFQLTIDLKPALDEKKLDARITRDFNKYKRKFFSNSLSDLLPSKLIPVIVKLSNISSHKPVHQITQNERLGLVNLLKNLRLNIIDYFPLSEAIVTSGGIDITEVDPSTMESKIINGLYFAGEILDVDGYTGGFNLQIAFSTGYLAGISC